MRLGGGVSTLRRYLQARLIDEMHLAISPVLRGSGEHLLHGLDLRALGYELARLVASANATHLVVEKKRWYDSSHLAANGCGEGLSFSDSADHASTR